MSDETEAQLATVTAERDALAADVKMLASLRDALVNEAKNLMAERDTLAAQLARATERRELAESERDEAIASRREAQDAVAVLEQRVGMTAAAAIAITPLQARKALRAAGLYDEVEAMLATASADVRDAWEYAIEWRPDDQLVVSIGAELGLGPTSIADLFALARTL